MEAELFRATKLLEIGRGNLSGLRAEGVTFETLRDIIITRYEAEGRKSIEHLKDRLAHLEKYFAGWRAKEITTDRLLAYAVHRRKQGAAISTVNIELTYMRRAFGLALEANRLAIIPRVVRLPGANVRHGFLEDAQLEAIVEKMSPHYRGCVWLLRRTGWRESEVRDLEWARVDMAAKEIRLYTSKNGEPRCFPYGTYPAVEEIIKLQRASAEAIQLAREKIVTHVFHHPDDGRRLSEPGFRKDWQTARKKVGLPNARLHDLRRTLVREMEARGVPRSVAMAITGHKTESIYRRYAIVAKADMEAGLAKLAGSLASNVVAFKREEGG